ncbi:MAG: MBL fold metallo-hydrolase, partial [Miltoncostaeaceae bacterium]
TYVVADREGGCALIVDPAAGSSRWVAETLSALAVEPVAVLDTHGHWDHVVENHVWDAQGIPVWVGRGDEGWLEAPAPFNPALFGNPPPTPGVTSPAATWCSRCWPPPGTRPACRWPTTRRPGRRWWAT